MLIRGDQSPSFSAPRFSERRPLDQRAAKECLHVLLVWFVSNALERLCLQPLRELTLVKFSRVSPHVANARPFTAGSALYREISKVVPSICRCEAWRGPAQEVVREGSEKTFEEVLVLRHVGTSLGILPSAGVYYRRAAVNVSNVTSSKASPSPTPPERR